MLAHKRWTMNEMKDENVRTLNEKEKQKQKQQFFIAIVYVGCKCSTTRQITALCTRSIKHLLCIMRSWDKFGRSRQFGDIDFSHAACRMPLHSHSNRKMLGKTINREKEKNKEEHLPKRAYWFKICTNARK